MSRIKDLTGVAFGKLTVVAHAGTDRRGRSLWHCLCECGGEKVVKAENLARGRTQSCGCMAQAQREQAAQSQAHAYSRSQWPREYKAWEGMIRRCTDPAWPQFADYGGRGLTVCSAWLMSFASFARDMGRAPVGGTIDRIDNTRGYMPENCRWASRKEQANNRRNNRLLTHNGRTMNVSQWAEHLGWKRNTLTNRLRNGWSVERTLTEAPHHHSP